MAYTAYDFDNLQPADTLKIERRVYFDEGNSDISEYITIPMEKLVTMHKDNIAEEYKIFETLCKSISAWEERAGQTLMFEKAIEYLNTPPVKHTSNKWEINEYGNHVISNMVYKMTYSFYEDTKYDHAAKKRVPCAWYVTWDVSTNTPNGNSGKSIAGQNRKRYTDKAELDKYIEGRIKAYARLFTEISPPIPHEFVRTFSVNGKLLPGYTIEGDNGQL